MSDHINSKCVKPSCEVSPPWLCFMTWDRMFVSRISFILCLWTTQHASFLRSHAVQFFRASSSCSATKGCVRVTLEMLSARTHFSSSFKLPFTPSPLLIFLLYFTSYIHSFSTPFLHFLLLCFFPLLHTFPNCLNSLSIPSFSLKINWITFTLLFASHSLSCWVNASIVPGVCVYTCRQENRERD